jgi:hypothetical protein
MLGRPSIAAVAVVKPANVTFVGPLQHARGRATLQRFPVVTSPPLPTTVPFPELVDVQLRHEFPLVLRPNPGEAPAVMKAAVEVRLGSSQAPVAGMGVADAAPRYSAAWQRWAPAKAAAHAA